MVLFLRNLSLYSQTNASDATIQGKKINALRIDYDITTTYNNAEIAKGFPNDIAKYHPASHNHSTRTVFIKDSAVITKNYYYSGDSTTEITFNCGKTYYLLESAALEGRKIAAKCKPTQEGTKATLNALGASETEYTESAETKTFDNYKCKKITAETNFLFMGKPWSQKVDIFYTSELNINSCSLVGPGGICPITGVLLFSDMKMNLDGSDQITKTISIKNEMVDLSSFIPSDYIIISSQEYIRLVQEDIRVKQKAISDSIALINEKLENDRREQKSIWRNLAIGLIQVAQEGTAFYQASKTPNAQTISTYTQVTANNATLNSNDAVQANNNVLNNTNNNSGNTTVTNALNQNISDINNQYKAAHPDNQNNSNSQPNTYTFNGNKPQAPANSNGSATNNSSQNSGSTSNSSSNSSSNNSVPPMQYATSCGQGCTLITVTLTKAEHCGNNNDYNYSFTNNSASTLDIVLYAKKSNGTWVECEYDNIAGGAFVDACWECDVTLSYITYYRPAGSTNLLFPSCNDLANHVK
jgi:hypothetical protein